MSEDKTRSMSYRIATAVFGLFWAGLGIAVLVMSDRSIGPFLASAGFVVLGVEAIFSALRNRLSLLSRIGPLP